MAAFKKQTGIWRKSCHSIGNGNCVQVAASSGAVLVRDSADPESLVISYPVGAWHAFVAAAKVAKLRASQ
jgi:Domain of unknown function (DUF397)